MVVSVENGCLMTSGDDPTDESKNPLENGGAGSPGDYNISSKENIEERSTPIPCSTKTANHATSQHISAYAAVCVARGRADEWG